MIDALTTNHTAFLREPDHFDCLSREILPGLAPRETIEIWSAACSTGEEVWTLACLLSDIAGLRSFHIAGSDISVRALRSAAEGLYPAERCAALPSRWLSRYFESPDRGATYRVTAPLRSRATFRRLNLIDSCFWPRRFPVIFCRNVMIYFDPA